jgi:hypothetical protein
MRLHVDGEEVECRIVAFCGILPPMPAVRELIGIGEGERA